MNAAGSTEVSGRNVATIGSAFRDVVERVSVDGPPGTEL